MKSDFPGLLERINRYLNGDYHDNSPASDYNNYDNLKKKSLILRKTKFSD